MAGVSNDERFSHRKRVESLSLRCRRSITISCNSSDGSGLTRAGRKSFQVVKLNQDYRGASTPHRHTRSTRHTPSHRQPATASAILLSLRARYYDGNTGEFASQDPLGYVDGMSLYRGYFLIGAVDIVGTQTRSVNGIQVGVLPHETPLGGFNSVNPDGTLYGWSNGSFFDHARSKKKTCVFELIDPNRGPRYPRVGIKPSEFPIFEIFHGTDLAGEQIPEHRTVNDIPMLIRRTGCCELIFLSHQGADANPGGISFGLGNEEYDPVLPSKNGSLEERIRVMLTLNKCAAKGGCDMFLYACGKNDDKVDSARLTLAKLVGCNVYGTKQTIHTVPVEWTDKLIDEALAGYEKKSDGPYHTDPSVIGTPCDSNAPAGSCWKYRPAPMFPYPSSNPIGLPSRSPSTITPFGY